MITEIKWSKDSNEAQKQIADAFGILGFEFPTNEEEVIAYDKMFKDYPYQLNPDCIDPHKLLKEIENEKLNE